MRSIAILTLAMLAGTALASQTAGALAAPTEIMVKESGCAAGTFCFEPSMIEVGGGDLPFILNNSAGKAPHNICFDVKGQVQCAPGPTRNDYAAPGSSNSSVVVRITEPGTYPYWCDVPGHRNLGMAGNVTLAATSVTPPTTPPTTPGGQDGTPGPGSSGPGTTGGETSKKSPAPAGVLVALGAAGLALALRRRGA